MIIRSKTLMRRLCNKFCAHYRFHNKKPYIFSIYRKDINIGAIEAVVKISFLERLRGLLFTNDLSCPIFITRCNDIHTFGMKYPLDLAFVSCRGEVLQTYRSVEPYKRKYCREAFGVFERPAQSAAWFQAKDQLKCYGLSIFSYSNTRVPKLKLRS